MLVVIVSVGLTSFLIGQGTTREFQQYLTSCDSTYIEVIETNLINFYRHNRGWNGIQGTLHAQIKSVDDRLVIADSSGVIVGDTGEDWLGKNIEEIGLNNPLQLIDSQQVVENRACMGTNVVLNIPEQNFLNRINDYLWVVGVIAAVVALFLGLILTRQITLPILALNRGAQRVAEGKLDYRVKVKSKDEIGELAQSFNSMASSLDKMEQSRRQLTADIAHELRTPLTVIEGTVDAMLDGVFTPDKEHLVSIKEQTVQLTHLINDLKDISLAESGRLRLEMVFTDMADLVRRKLAQNEISAADKGIELKLEVDRDIPDVMVDPARMDQVVANLLTNAIRHTPSGGEITVSLKTIYDTEAFGMDKPVLLVSVVDTGEGIQREHLTNIFERFYRVESSRQKNAGETGLGLAIVKQMIEAHGGKVWAKSEPGKGSTFFIAILLPELRLAN
jgi:signal transduction histidine kinase